MAWKECDRVSQRREFVTLASKEGAKIAPLCRRFGISRRVGYKWLDRYKAQGEAGLHDRSRRPHQVRTPTSEAMEQAVLAVRAAHPAWGGRKIAAVLQRQGHDPDDVPAPSTITRILHRHGLIDPHASAERQPIRRFERPAPNDLWQMDFKGPFHTADQRACHPLTLLDDHSRYALCLHACIDQKRPTVQQQLTRLFERYGLPWQMLMDNGTPWATSHRPGGHTRLSVWLMRLGIQVSNGRPYHPQTQGKEERFHRTLKIELLQDRSFRDCEHAQRHFDPWRHLYNHERPHQAIGMAVPAERYQPSTRSMPRTLAPVEYGSSDHVRKVNAVGQVRFQGRTLKLSEAFAGEPVALRPTRDDGVWQVCFSRFEIARVNLHELSRDDRGRRGSGTVEACG